MPVAAGWADRRGGGAGRHGRGRGCAIVLGSVTDGRDVAQFGSALDWGSRGRRFKSGRPDGFFERLYPEMGTKPAMIIPT
jgi:hypothetical protein